jgi:hypothetical protein
MSTQTNIELGPEERGEKEKNTALKDENRKYKNRLKPSFFSAQKRKEVFTNSA